MKQICAKVYYLISTGEIILITPEMQGSCKETTKGQDMDIYPQLKDRNIDEVDFIKLEYGSFTTTFQNIKSYNVNLETKSLECEYLTTEDLQSIQAQEQEIQSINTRISDIWNYLIDQTDMISSIEDQILQTELNKTTEGMI